MDNYKTNKKRNMEYWDDMELLTEKYVEKIAYMGDTELTDEDDILFITKKVLEFTTELLEKRSKAKFPYVDMNY